MMHKRISTLHISIVILINSSGSKFNKIAIIIILITIIIKYRRHIVIIVLLNSRWTENNTIFIVIIVYRRHSIIKVNFLLRAWGTKNIMLIKTSFPKLRLFHRIRNNDVQSIDTSNIAISLQTKFHWFFNFLFKHLMS